MLELFENPLEDVYTSALLYGIGIIKITNGPHGPEMRSVPHTEFLDLADALTSIAENIIASTPKKVNP